MRDTAERIRSARRVSRTMAIRSRSPRLAGERLEPRLALAVEVTGTSGVFGYSRSPTEVTITSVDSRFQPLLTVPDTIDGLPVTSIAPLALQDYNGPRIAIPATIRTIGAGAFSRCRLGWVDVAADNPVFTSREGAVYDRSMSRLCAVPGGRGGVFTVPQGVRVIGSSAFFECAALESVELPAGVTTIEGAAFSGCLGLSYIALPETLETLSSQAFAWCRSLATVSIPAGVSRVADNAFLGCEGLHSIDVADGNPFYADVDGVLLDGSRSRLVACPPGRQGAVTVPAGVSVLGENSFTLCPQLTEVTLPASVTRIERGAFSASYALGRLNFLGLPPDLGAEPVWPGETFVTSVAQGYRIDAKGGWDQLTWNLQRPLDEPERFGGMVVTPVPEAALAAHVAGVNHAPIDISCSGNSVKEKQPVGTFVGELSVIDRDVGDACTFAVVDPFVPFTVDGNRLVSSYPLLFDAKRQYLVRVRATDSRGLATERVLPINVEDVDDTPRILAVTPPQPRAYRLGEVLTFTVTCSQPVTVSGKPVLDLTAGQARRSAEYASGSGSTQLVFAYRVKKSDTTLANLVLADSIRLPSRRDKLQAVSGGAVSRSLPGGGVPGVSIDTIAPRITAISYPGTGSYGPGAVLRFVVTFSEQVTVNGTPTIPLTLDRNVAATAAFVSGSGGSSLVFEYVVRPGDTAARGPRVARAIALAGGAIRDAAGNAAALQFRLPKMTGVVIVPGLSPAG